MIMPRAQQGKIHTYQRNKNNAVGVLRDEIIVDNEHQEMVRTTKKL